MESRKWDAYRTLNITSRDSNGTTCVGNNRYGKRCRWDTDHEDYLQIRVILDELETKSPTQATSWFPTLAQLSLCDDYHQGQSYEKISEWETAVQEAASFYQNSRGRDSEEEIKELKQALEEERKGRRALTQDWERKYECGMRRIEEQSAQKLKEQMEKDLKSHRKLAKAHGNRMTEAQNLIVELNVKLEDECKTSELNLETTMKDYLSLQKRNAELALQVTTQDDLLKTRASLLKKLKSEQQANRAEINELIKKLEAGDIGNERLNSNLTTLKNKLKAEVESGKVLQSELHEVTKTATELRFSLNESELDKGTLYEAESNLRSEFNIQIEMVQHLREEIEQVRHSYDSSTQEVKKLQVTLSSERHATSKLAEKFEITRLTLANEQEKLRHTEEQLSSNGKDMEAAQNNLSKAMNDLDHLRRTGLKKESDLSEGLDKTKHMLLESQQEVSTIRGDLEDATTNLDVAQDELTKVLKAMEDVRREKAENESELVGQIQTLTRDILYSKNHLVRSLIGGLLSNVGRWTWASFGWFRKFRMRRLHAGVDEQGTPLFHLQSGA